MSRCPHCQSSITLDQRLPLIWQQGMACPHCDTELHTAEHHCALNMIGVGLLTGALGAAVLGLSSLASMALAFVFGQLVQAFAGPLEEPGPKRSEQHTPG